MTLGRQYFRWAALCFLTFFLSSQVVLGQVPTEKSLLWEISGKGLAKPSYLYGTVHLACPNQLVVPNPLKEKLAATKQLYLELDFDDPNLVATTLQGMVMHDGTRLRSLLNTQDYAKAQRFFQQSTKLSLDQVGTIKPFFLISLLYPSLIGCQLASWEGTLTKLAQSQNIEVLGIETVQQQLTVFDKIPLKDQATQLMEVVNNPEKTKQQLQQMMTDYRNQDIVMLYRAIAKSSPSAAKYESVLLTERNQRWIPAIEKAAQAKPTFFAFGAGHLGGNYGVITLLRKAGYVVRPVILNYKS
jgi:uncharacterized protein YbaP (TraB family)